MLGEGGGEGYGLKVEPRDQTLIQQHGLLAERRALSGEALGQALGEAS